MKENDDAELFSSTPTQRLHMEEQDSLLIADQEQEDELVQHLNTDHFCLFQIYGY